MNNNPFVKKPDKFEIPTGGMFWHVPIRMYRHVARAVA